MVSERHCVVRDGLGAAWPVCLGYLPIGLSFGVLAQKAGLGPLHVLLMSVLVFAGGSQFIAVAMIGSGVSAVTIVATTFVVNLRHLLMSSAMSVHFPGISRRFLALFAYGVTDESFAVNMARFRGEGWDRWRALTMNQAANACWVVSTVAGVYIGNLVPPGAFGIDYALTGMFICLLTFQFRERLHIITAVVAAVLSVSFSLIFQGNGHIIAASCAAATIGFLIKRHSRKRKVHA
ncbi:AzlC family ABC transporter permease [Geomonas sp. RF6]|uniref:AzlC family ABC transporter permease n=1 Tax=Geomonas sp. RF6 TaxID=2897342 RepID=UPI001E539101|nr:AzlC family ABC transporter permease [Geomonas sp. RF6]UFS70108.1 AzlC family ABC transporter permease [Geomonas sp. RF6]